MPALPREIADKLDDVRALCEKHRVKRLEIFGSAVKGTFDSGRSDIDLVVEFLPEPDPLRHGRAYLDLWKALRRLFDREIDLLEVQTLGSSYFARAIDTSRVEIYDAAA
ncbi:MAG TPA: nucleotidyltransferase domain-containing protein [Thermoanaerobaculia bacterium]|jgi:hypothetical protein